MLIVKSTSASMKQRVNPAIRVNDLRPAGAVGGSGASLVSPCDVNEVPGGKGDSPPINCSYACYSAWQGRRERLLSARDLEIDRVTGGLSAPSGVAHQINADGILAVLRQVALEAISGRGANEHRAVGAGRHHVEVSEAVTGLHDHHSRLSGFGAQKIVDGLVALDAAFDDGSGLALF
jgi:hypothetical protein